MEWPNIFLQLCQIRLSQPKLFGSGTDCVNHTILSLNFINQNHSSFVFKLKYGTASITHTPIIAQVHAELASSSAVNGAKTVNALAAVLTTAKTNPVIKVGVS